MYQTINQLKYYKNRCFCGYLTVNEFFIIIYIKNKIGWSFCVLG